MKKIFTIMAVIAVILTLSGFALKNENQGMHKKYTLEIKKDHLNELLNIKFNIPEESMVKITAQNKCGNKELILVEGEMEKGEYIVLHKTDCTSSEDKTEIRMEVTTDESSSILSVESE